MHFAHFALVLLCSVHAAHCSVQTIVYQQKLDHFNVANKVTFPQTYYVIDDHFRTSDGPVFLFLGTDRSETPQNINNNGLLIMAAKAYNALIVAIEQHRYFGKSFNSDMLKTENLKYLTTQQMLADTAAIVYEVRTRYQVQNNTWIVFGGSNSGILSILFRQKYPSLVAASVSSSAAIKSTYDLWKLYAHIGWQLANVTLGGSMACYDGVMTAFNQFDQYLDFNNYQQLQRDFKLCESNLDLADTKNKFAIASVVSSVFLGVALRNELDPGISIRELICPRFAGATPQLAYDNLKLVFDRIFQTTGQRCTNGSWVSFLAPRLQHVDGVMDPAAYETNSDLRAYSYAVCAHLGFIPYCDRSRDCPLSKYLTRDGVLHMCMEAFNLTESDVRAANVEYQRYYDPDHLQIGNLIATNGVADISYPYGITEDDHAKQIYAVRIDNVGSMADLSPPSQNDSPALKAARQQVVDLIGSKFLGVQSFGLGFLDSFKNHLKQFLTDLINNY